MSELRLASQPSLAGNMSELRLGKPPSLAGNMSELRLGKPLFQPSGDKRVTIRRASRSLTGLSLIG
jgi:hypothetical protein